MSRNEDKQFIDTYGRDKTFLNGLEGDLEKYEGQLNDWFTLQVIRRNQGRPDFGNGYILRCGIQLGSKNDPIKGRRIAFYPKSAVLKPDAHLNIQSADLVIQQVILQGRCCWRIIFPGRTDTGTAFHQLLNLLLKRRLGFGPQVRHVVFEY